jgi:hypothetical protein
LEVLNRGGYGFPTDVFGVKNSNNPQYEYYEQRNNLVKFTNEIDDNIDNEVMVKNRIGPEFIKGFTVANQYDKSMLMQKLRTEGLVELRGNVEYIIGKNKPLEDFISIGNHFSQNMWK